MKRKKTDEQKAAEAREKRQTQFSTADGALVQAMDGIAALDARVIGNECKTLVDAAYTRLRAAREELAARRAKEGL